MDIRQRIRDSLLQEKTGVTGEDIEALAVEQCVARLSADEWQDLQEAFNGGDCDVFDHDADSGAPRGRL